MYGDLVANRILLRTKDVHQQCAQRTYCEYGSTAWLYGSFRNEGGYYCTVHASYGGEEEEGAIGGQSRARIPREEEGTPLHTYASLTGHYSTIAGIEYVHILLKFRSCNVN